ncbi:hypothetical protein MLD38_027926 [Melastoma candidum]|uniref:Uncharacterized protein n=1 Tax=Melastoma candidum TaxID=119954 RepID=A0ACB9N0C9_9MYRT|nr:hypothetical protein MLD38_027926 [Melastoma candidum]
MMTFTLLLSFFLSFHAIVLYCISLGHGWSALYAFLLPLAGVLLTGAFLVMAARATVMTWIMVLVLLAFSGKRRRVLVVQGRKIMADVAMYLVWVVFSGRGLAAVLCAAIISFLLVPR